MARAPRQLISRLNDLIALDLDAVRAYEAALTRIQAASIKGQLRLFQRDHQRHIDDLSLAVRRLEGAPRVIRDAKGSFTEAFTGATSVRGDEAALQAMQGNADLMTSAYREALAESWTHDLRALLERNQGDERRHLTFIRQALKSRQWEQSQNVGP